MAHGEKINKHVIEVSDWKEMRKLGGINIGRDIGWEFSKIDERHQIRDWEAPQAPSKINAKKTINKYSKKNSWIFKEEKKS